MKLNDVEIIRLDSFGGVKHIASLLGKEVNEHNKRFTFLIDDCITYPNVCAPLAGLIDFYKTKNVRIELKFLGDGNSYISKLNFDSPLKVEDESNSIFLDNPFDKIWFFETFQGETKLVNSLIMAIRRMDVLNEGVLSGLEWCLNETMDNVLVHSEAPKGFVMAQYHQTNKLFSVCIFDYGIGIYNSFKNSKHHPRSKGDAITLALQERVTRDDSIGQGNGLWGLHQIIEENKGVLKITSHGAHYQMVFEEDGNISNEVFEKGNALLFDPSIGTTLIDFQVSTNNTINIEKALHGHEVVDLWEENLENDNGDYVVDVATVSQGTGTRPAAEELRNVVLNLAINNKNKVILDFSHVSTISSSYADELIGKMISKYGLLFFNKKIEIVNLNKTNTTILERSVKQRMAQSYYDEIIEDDE